MPRNARNAAAASLACVAAFGVLVVVAYGVDPLQTADARLLSWFAAYEDTTAGSVANAIAFLVDPVPLLVLVAIVCGYGFSRGRVTESVAALTIVAGANLTTQVVKHLLAHGRFQAFLENQPDLTTFPSGHVTAAASLVLAVAFVVPALLRRRILAAGSLFVLAVGLSVLVLEWHFPSDALGGVLVAMGWGFGVVAVYRSLPPRLRRFNGRSRLTPPPAGTRAAVPTK